MVSGEAVNQGTVGQNVGETATTTDLGVSDEIEFFREFVGSVPTHRGNSNRGLSFSLVVAVVAPRPRSPCAYRPGPRWWCDVMFTCLPNTVDTRGVKGK